MNEQGLNQLKKHEGFRAIVYLCTAGKRTIGYGRNIDDNPLTEKEIQECKIDTSEHLILTPVQADALLRMDMKERISAVDSAFAVLLPFLNEPRRWVLYNMAYNLGVSKLKELMTFRAVPPAIMAGDFKQAADRMRLSKWAIQTKTRAAQLTLQMEKGEWI
jgi:lysozyme